MINLIYMTAQIELTLLAFKYWPRLHIIGQPGIQMLYLWRDCQKEQEMEHPPACRDPPQT
jgi:hypothetical protein